MTVLTHLHHSVLPVCVSEYQVVQWAASPLLEQAVYCTDIVILHSVSGQIIYYRIIPDISVHVEGTGPASITSRQGRIEYRGTKPCGHLHLDSQKLVLCRAGRLGIPAL